MALFTTLVPTGRPTSGATAFEAAGTATMRQRRAKTPSAPHDAHGRLILRVLRWGLLGAATFMLARFVRDGWPEVQQALSALTRDQAPFVVLALLAETVWVVAMAQVYRSALRAFGGDVSRADVLRISMAAFTLSRIIPGGGAAGGAVAARELMAAGNPALRTVASMLASWWISMTGLSAIVFAGTAAAAARGTLPVGYVAAPAAALAVFAVGGAGIVVAARHVRVRTLLSGAVTRAAARLGHTVVEDTGPASLPAVPTVVRVRGLVGVFAWSLVVWVLDAAALWLSLAAFGWKLDIGVILVGYSVANLIQALPELTPGWLGVLEASVAVTLSAFGVPTGIAVAGVLVYRLVSYWLPTAAGLPSAIAVLGHTSRAGADLPGADVDANAVVLP